MNSIDDTTPHESAGSERGESGGPPVPTVEPHLPLATSIPAGGAASEPQPPDLPQPRAQRPSPSTDEPSSDGDDDGDDPFGSYYAQERALELSDALRAAG